MTDTIQKFDYSIDVMRALLWQYQESTALRSILQSKQDWYDTNQEEFWQDWYDNVFNLATADDFGLTVWSIILGQPLIVSSGPSTRKTWGFGTPHFNFTRGNFGSTTGSTYRLSTETARVLLQLRYFQLTSSGTVPETNRMLAAVFGEKYGKAWLNDELDMTQFYTFAFPLPSDLQFIFNNFDVLPRPAGVKSSYRVVAEEAWGFDQYHENFDHGNFSEL